MTAEPHEDLSEESLSRPPLKINGRQGDTSLGSAKLLAKIRAARHDLPEPLLIKTITGKDGSLALRASLEKAKQRRAMPHIFEGVRPKFLRHIEVQQGKQVALSKRQTSNNQGGRIIKNRMISRYLRTHLRTRTPYRDDPRIERQRLEEKVEWKSYI
ncbi:hypothetical protein ACFE04_028257 [Oxalis oulophora]